MLSNIHVFSNFSCLEGFIEKRKLNILTGNKTDQYKQVPTRSLPCYLNDCYHSSHCKSLIFLKLLRKFVLP